MIYVKHVLLSRRGENDKREYLKDEDRSVGRDAFTVLRQMGYDGTVSIEASTDNFRRDAAASLRILRES